MAFSTLVIHNIQYWWKRRRDDALKGCGSCTSSNLRFISLKLPPPLVLPYIAILPMWIINFNNEFSLAYIYICVYSNQSKSSQGIFLFPFATIYTLFFLISYFFFLFHFLDFFFPYFFFQFTFSSQAHLGFSLLRTFDVSPSILLNTFLIVDEEGKKIKKKKQNSKMQNRPWAAY